MLSEILLRRGYEVEAAYCGKEALGKVSESSPDLILLDVKMPDMSGIEVCQLLASNPSTRNIPVILITATKKSDKLALGLDAGAIDFVEKPFETTELMARVRSALRLKNYMDNLEKIVEERTREITASEKKYRELVEATEDLIFQTDAHGRITFLNSLGAESLGLNLKEIAGLPFLKLIHPEDRKGV
ncbi:MAG: response regulator, partial [Deltaproteobacteria bacterium]|nr:response regulator [Deltaproteobacteria bacterium]